MSRSMAWRSGIEGRDEVSGRGGAGSIDVKLLHYISQAVESIQASGSQTCVVKAPLSFAQSSPIRS